MKKLSMLILSLFLLLTASHAQFKAVPAEVINTFNSTYPTAKNVSWKSGFSSYEARFEWEGDKAVAKYTNKGEWKETERARKFDALSNPVKDGFRKSKYTDWEMRDVQEIREKDKETLFRINVRKNDLNTKNLYFNADGKLVKD
jgi:opacity protein-like surface antigen